MGGPVNPVANSGRPGAFEVWEVRYLLDLATVQKGMQTRRMYGQVVGPVPGAGLKGMTRDHAASNPTPVYVESVDSTVMTSGIAGADSS